MTIIKTINALSAALEEVFGEAPLHKDVNEGFDRPATFITVDGVTVTKMSGQTDEVISLRITRFATQDYKGYLELLKYAEILGALLTCPIRHSSGFCVYPDDIQLKLYRDEMVLESTFTVENCVALSDDDDGYAGTDATDIMQILKDKYNFKE